MSKKMQYIIFSTLGIGLIVGAYFLFVKSEKDDSKETESGDDKTDDTDIVAAGKENATIENTVYVPELDMPTSGILGRANYMQASPVNMSLQS